MARIIYCIEPEAHNSLHVHFKEFENMIICFGSQLFRSIIPPHFCIEGSIPEFCGINLFLTWQQFKNHSIVLFIFTRGRNTFNVFISLYVCTFKFLTVASISLKEEDREGGQTMRILSGEHLQYRGWWRRGVWNAWWASLTLRIYLLSTCFIRSWWGLRRHQY